MKKRLLISTIIIIVLVLITTLIFTFTKNNDNSNLERIRLADTTLTSRKYI